jgi:hypothetical protein
MHYYGQTHNGCSYENSMEGFGSMDNINVWRSCFGKNQVIFRLALVFVYVCYIVFTCDWIDNGEALVVCLRLGTRNCLFIL